MNRRNFIQVLTASIAAGIIPTSGQAQRRMPSDFYEIPSFGNACLMHITDCHAQLLPSYLRESSTNIGVADSLGRSPYLVGEHLLNRFGIPKGTAEAHALTHLDFEREATLFGKVGGFSHLATLVKRIRAERGENNTLLLDGGDTWQGSGTSYLTQGKDMIGACNLLGVDAMTGHWEFTYPAATVLDNIGSFSGDFLAQNVFVKDEAVFDYQFADDDAYNEETGTIFRPSVIRSVNGHRIAIIGQAFPYTPIANPAHFIPDWTFGIQEKRLQGLVDALRQQEKPDAVVLLSHNGMDVDLKLASRVSGIDVVFGGHTHDALPQPVVVSNKAGKTLVVNGGSNGKYLGLMDLQITNKKVVDFRYRLIPVFSNLIPPDSAMQEYIRSTRTPHSAWLSQSLGEAGSLLYRKDNFKGTFDQIINDALRIEHDAEISLSPGFRWGTTLLPGQTITMEDVLDQCCISYPNTYRREMSGAQLKTVLEDVCDNLFNADPYFRQGGDMVRVDGIRYSCNPTEKIGHRISDMTHEDGTPIEADRVYTVAGWADVNDNADGPMIWDVVSKHIQDVEHIGADPLIRPKLIGVEGNPGIDDSYT